MLSHPVSIFAGGEKGDRPDWPQNIDRLRKCPCGKGSQYQERANGVQVPKDEPRGNQGKQKAQQVLAAGNPCHGFNSHGMDRHQDHHDGSRGKSFLLVAFGKHLLGNLPDQSQDGPPDQDVGQVKMGLCAQSPGQLPINPVTYVTNRLKVRQGSRPDEGPPISEIVDLFKGRR